MSVVIVTGAGSGIGRAIAKKLANDGYSVVVNDIRKKAADAVAKEIGGSVLAVVGDVSKEADVAKIVNACKKKFGAPSHLVNNAGHVHQSRFENLKPADFDRMIAVHLRGAFLMTKAVLGGMLRKEKGAIVNIASIHARMTYPKFFPYAAAKSGVIGLTRNLALDEGEYNIRTKIGRAHV